MTHARVLHHIISRLMTVVVCVLLMIFKLAKIASKKKEKEKL